jgi:hypothetical protein
MPCSCSKGGGTSQVATAPPHVPLTYNNFGQTSRLPVIVLPVSFHILKGGDMVKEGLVMDTWVSCMDVPVLMAEINRIWQPAKVKFELERCKDVFVLGADYQSSLIQTITESEKDDEDRAGAVWSLEESLGVYRGNSLNVYLYPFMGSNTQGIARIGGNKAIIGVWSDKHVKGLPVKSLLIEDASSMDKGSIARTIAHELGHNLGLIHPKDGVEDFPRLMGGEFPGYGLTDAEIKTAREFAEAYSDEFKVKGWGG